MMIVSLLTISCETTFDAITNSEETESKTEEAGEQEGSAPITDTSLLHALTQALEPLPVN